MARNFFALSERYNLNFANIPERQLQGERNLILEADLEHSSPDLVP